MYVFVRAERLYGGHHFNCQSVRCIGLTVYVFVRAERLYGGYHFNCQSVCVILG